MKTKCNCYLSYISQHFRVKHSQLKDGSMRRVHESKFNYYKFQFTTLTFNIPKLKHGSPRSKVAKRDILGQKFLLGPTNILIFF
jgi:hypothetical protein